MTYEHPNTPLISAFRTFLTTTTLNRTSGTIAYGGSLRPNKVSIAIEALRLCVDDYYADTSAFPTDAQAIGERFWRHVSDANTDGNEWRRPLDYANDRIACRQIGQWVIDARHLVSEADRHSVVPGTNPGPITNGLVVWAEGIGICQVVDNREGIGGLCDVVTRRNGRAERLAVARGTVTPLGDRVLVFDETNPPGAFEAYAADTDENRGRRWVFDRCWSTGGLGQDQAIWIRPVEGGEEVFVPHWRMTLETPVTRAPVVEAPRETTDLSERFLYDRETGQIVWAEGWAASGVAFDAYTHTRGADRTGTRVPTLGAKRYVDYAEMVPGLPLEMVEESSYSYPYATQGQVTYFTRPYDGDSARGRYALRVHHERDMALADRTNGYVGAAHVRVKVEDIVPEGAPEPVAGVVTIDGVDYYRKADVDADLAVIASTLHQGATENGLCSVYDRVVGQANERTQMLTIGQRRRTRYVDIEETYTVRRTITVENSEDDDAARRYASDSIRQVTAPRETDITSFRRTNMAVTSVRT